MGRRIDRWSGAMCACGDPDCCGHVVLKASHLANGYWPASDSRIVSSGGKGLYGQQSRAYRHIPSHATF